MVEMMAQKFCLLLCEFIQRKAQPVDFYRFWILPGAGGGKAKVTPKLLCNQAPSIDIPYLQDILWGGPTLMNAEGHISLYL